MAIDNITPVADSQLDPGTAFSFKVDNTYTSMTIEVETASGWEYAYDSSLGGAQAGYTVSVAVGTGGDAGRHIFTVTRSAGWNLSPFSIRVVENETGTSATTTTNYTLYSANDFPQSSDPYFLQSLGDSFLSHSDTPSSYAGQGGKAVLVKGTEDGLEFAIGGSTDANAIHDNIANEISALTEKVTPADDDIFIIEDSAASYIKKKVKKSSIGGGGAAGSVALGKWKKGADTIGATAADSFDVNSAVRVAITSIRILASNPDTGAAITALVSDADFPAAGYLYLQDTTGSDYIVFKVSSHTLTGGVYWDLTVSYLAHSGSAWTANAYTAVFVPQASGGSGDVVGPASATDNAIARFDATTGKLIQNSSVLVGDTGNLFLDNIAAGAPMIRMAIPSSAPSAASGKGYWYIGGSGTATTPLFKDGGGTEYQLNKRTLTLSGGGRHTGAAITGQWYGQNYWGPWADSNMATTWGASSGDPNFNGIANVVPYAGTVTKFVVYYTVNPATVDGEIALWKVGITDGTTSSTYTKVASVDLGAAKVDSISERYVDEVTCNTAVNAGDQLVMLLAHTTTGATCFAAYTAIVEYT